MELLEAILMLFVVLDAPGNAPLFHYFTKDLPYPERLRTIRLSILVAGLILTLFAFFGEIILKYFNITVNDFRIAGGVILFLYAVLGLLGRSLAEQIKTEEVAIVPLATPLLAGPGAITVTIYLKYVSGLIVVLVSIAINMILAWVLLENGERVLRYIGRSGSTILSKIMSILLAAYAIAMIREGVIEVFKVIGSI